ncbi:DUF5803 family protein [Natronorarus salvus]|uniref:DUF5803 family protein n=1 Tax=Natronorarus salvus TaxID=3117733 RepID=UPI002F268DDC
MNRRLTATLAVAVLLILSGCAGLGSTTSEDGLAAEPTEEYPWESDRDGTIVIGDGEYRAVYRVENQSTVLLYQSTRYGDDRPIPVESIRFQYEDGTVVDYDSGEIEVDESRTAVTVELPAEDGKLAYTGSTRSRNFDTRTVVPGSYEVVLPPGYRADNFILGTIRPGGYEQTIEDDRVHLTWEEVGSSTISLRYYQERDVTLFTGLVVVASAGALIALARVRKQIKELQRKREEAGLDIDIEDDRDDPPPGMR